MSGPMSAYAKPCGFCGASLLMAITLGGRRRASDADPVDPGAGVYRFRRDAGMVEVDDLPGYRVHVCLERALAGHTATGIVEDLS